MSRKVQVLSPLKGWCASLEDNPDPVFSGRMLGDGVSIDPLVGELRAPFDAEVLTVPESAHAVNLRAGNGAELLVHIGVDTVNLAGEGFEALVAPGDLVSAGQVLVRFDLDHLLRHAASLRTPVLLLKSDRYDVAGVPSEGPVDFGDPLFEIVMLEDAPQAAEQELAVSAGQEISRTVIVGLEHGIHARPAALLAAAVRELTARVSCRKGDDQANALSPVALMSLGVSHGDVVTVAAEGSQAEAALEAFISLLDPRDAGESPVEPPVSSPAPDKEQVNPPGDGSVLKAQPASPGLAAGQAHLLTARKFSEHQVAGSPGQERNRLEQALDAVRAHLEKLAADEGDSGQRVGTEIAAAHRALMDDPLLLGAAQDAIQSGQSAEAAWRSATESAARALQRLEDPRLRERADDMEDIDLRVQRTLAGEAPGTGPDLPEQAILVADNLLPSQLLEIDRANLEGVVLAGGGATSHVAILAMSLGIPLMVAAGPSILAIENGADLLLDADLGELHVRPDADTAASFQRRLKQDAKHRANELGMASESCVTRDGERIHVLANIASAADAAAAVERGAEGCGLLRTEFLYMGRADAPNAEEQRAIYQAVADALGDRPLVVRTLDAGGDKPVAYLDQPAEENPALGVRGIRLALANPELLREQLQALMAVRHPVPLKVMIPMVTSVAEVKAVRELLGELGWTPGDPAAIRLGVMIETPAAALVADRLAGLVDFFSIGTNDLAQYTLCMDRGEPRLANDLDVLHPAVLMLIAQAARSANDAGIGLAVCGGAAGDALAAPLLLGLGIRELSMPGGLVPRQKARLRNLEISRCAVLAEQALGLQSTAEVRRLVQDRLAADTAD